MDGGDVADTCAGCNKPLTILPNGSRLRCCGKGYWSGLAPLARDAWWPVKRSGGRTLYRRHRYG